MTTKLKIFTLLFAITVLFSSISYGGETITINLDTIKQIESSGNPDAYNPKTNAIGAYQIRIPALRDFNLSHIRNGYSHEEMYDEAKAYLVANWYMNVAIPRYLRNMGIEDTIFNRLAGYNWGVGNLKKHYDTGLEIPSETKEYIEKYRRTNE